MMYPATFVSSGNGSYDVIFNDLPGCTANGENLDEAMTEASQALARYMECLEEEGTSAPRPSRCEDLEKELADPDQAFIRLVGFEGKKRAAKKNVQRVSVSIKPGVLERLDDTAEKLGVSRSALIALAVNDYCSRVKT